MPMLDMSAALTNPFTLDTFNVIRQQETLNGFGESVVTKQVVTNLRGVVYPETDMALMRQPNMQLASKTIAIVTKFALRTESIGYQPDIIVWNGNQYVVTHLGDYSNFGTGFIRATAQIIDAEAIPPTTE
jgi:hypothetical protein